VKRGALIAAIASVAALLTGSGAFAVENERLGEPTAGAIDFQPPATNIMEEIRGFHGFLLPIIVAVSVFVLALLLWVIVRYNRRANPTPRKFTHNMLVEVIWTIVPVLILVAIAWKSFPLIFREERIPPNAEITLKVTGNQWFWQYEYPDQHVSLTSILQPEADVAAWNAAHPDPTQQRTYLLATNNPIVVPMDTTVRLLITSNDVIHAWAVPAFGVKEDATQGRVNDSWFRIESRLVGQGEHTFYGQCSELCGKDHAYMPIEVRAVPRDEFNRWLASQGGTMAFGQAAATPAAATTTATPAAPPPASGSAPAPAQTPSHTR